MQLYSIASGLRILIFANHWLSVIPMKNGSYFFANHFSSGITLFSKSETTDFKDGVSLEEVFEAYFSCRNNKRNTINALAFELDYENNLIQLWEDLNDGIAKFVLKVRPVKKNQRNANITYKQAGV